MAVSDHTISFVRANVVGGMGGIAAGAGVLALFTAVHGAGILDDVDYIFAHEFAVAAAVIVLAIVMHEALHGIGFCCFGRAPRHSVRFGIHWKTLSPFAGSSAAMPARGYRLAVLLPGLVLGVLPALGSLVNGSAALAMFGALMVMGAGGDAAALWAMRHVPGDVLVRDAVARVGCEVVTG
ncbi:MAG TPA: DUF3267 domain-containing protein [Longimicrobiales bacterium]|nr:DUF3267 domain-containing protein [Longimicrobiales bacterium]